MASPCLSVQKGGDTEGGRMVRLQMDAKRCATQEAISRARGSCCLPTPVSRKAAPLESTNLQARLAACAQINAQQATLLASQPLRGMSEGARISILINETCSNQDRFAEYSGPRVATVCPPMPTEITNAHLPKPSTRCDTLNLLATGSPPNSIP